MSRRASVAGAMASNVRLPTNRGSGSTSGQVAASTATATMPVGLRSGDVLVALACLTVATDALNTPAGWTAVGPVSNVASHKTYLFHKTSDGTETGITVTKSAGTTGTVRVDLTVWKNSAGVAASASDVSATGDGLAVLPSVTPTVNNSTLVGAIHWAGTVGAFTALHWIVTVNNGANPATTWYRRGPVPASASTTATINSGGAFRWSAFTLALSHV